MEYGVWSALGGIALAWEVAAHHERCSHPTLSEIVWRFHTRGGRKAKLVTTAVALHVWSHFVFKTRLVGFL